MATEWKSCGRHGRQAATKTTCLKGTKVYSPGSSVRDPFDLLGVLFLSEFFSRVKSDLHLGGRYLRKTTCNLLGLLVFKISCESG